MEANMDKEITLNFCSGKTCVVNVHKVINILGVECYIHRSMNYDGLKPETNPYYIASTYGSSGKIHSLGDSNYYIGCSTIELAEIMATALTLRHKEYFLNHTKALTKEIT